MDYELFNSFIYYFTIFLRITNKKYFINNSKTIKINDISNYHKIFLICSFNSYLYNNFKLYNNKYYKEIKIKDQDKYILLEQHSSNKHTVYSNTNNNKIIVAFKGSSSISDILTCLSLNIKNTKYYINELIFIRKLKKKYPNFKFIYTGHSMGGLLAYCLSYHFNDYAIIFNPYIPNNVKSHKGNNIIVYINPYDILSFGSFTKVNNIYLLKKKFNLLKETDFHKIGSLFNNNSIVNTNESFLMEYIDNNILE